MTPATSDRIAAAILGPVTAQRTFRAVMDALARPGRVVELPHAELPPVLLPVAALADLGTGVCVLGDDGWADAVRVATNAPSATVDDARLVAATRPVTAAEIRSMRRGAALAPEESALAAVPVSAVDSGSALRLTGPGVDGTRTIAPAGLPDGVIAARAEAVAGFPAGVDLLLIDPDGRLLGLPRTSAIESRED
ncbi:MAG: phosphonate C-P lyase system protein PhnH [Propionibacteriales bacterium]|nr:phosphonate C-P lyase system protein PhnH [Propionibacteriales bacterium]